jgi:flagellar hook-associated protein 3 FlgL
VLRLRADVGARINRLDLTENRMLNDVTNFTRLMSENENVDMTETIMNLKNEENVYRASLAGGARIIMPSLVDFLR